MKRKVFLFLGGLIGAVLLVLLCNRRTIILGEPSAYNVVTAEEFSFSVTDVSEECVEAVLVNHSDGKICWGSQFALEKQVDGVWYNVELQMPEGIKLMWNDMLYHLVSGESTTLKFSLMYRGDLPKGEYRIVRQFFIGGNGGSEEKYVAAQFCIE